ncbi:hypothetical protein L2E82_32441 [Cichorium intybus]|uniref:Uncharacterized protein n=1 Tax=Cichorium intybus TaxID=13427 RepID=A0ACB9BGT9_CICIN|nr:hypothetical protein L2E82_32441 [Cichorium intybus]
MLKNHNNGNPPYTRESPASVGFNTDQLPFNSRTSKNHSDYDDDEAVVDPNIIGDELEEGDEDEGEGENRFNDNCIEDYPRIDEHDQYEWTRLDDSHEDEKDFDQMYKCNR